MEEKGKSFTPWRIIEILAGLGGAIGFCLYVLGIFSPSIDVFRPTAYQVIRGERVTVTWQVSGNPTEVLLDGRGVRNTGEESFTLNGDRTFILAARKRFWLLERRV